MAQPAKPILVAHLYPKIEAALLELLRSLTPEDWERQTLAPAWNVKDVAAHLLDTQLRKLSICRDHIRPFMAEITPDADVIAFINRLNAEGVSYYRRLSPAVLISSMQVASEESSRFHQSLDAFADAVFPVSWAGESTSLNWFDTAREFTERWHHQQQIRLAVGKRGIETRELFHPVLDCFMRALPFHYASKSRPSGTLARFTISGDCGGSWYLYRDAASWSLVEAPLGNQVSETIIPQDIAWRLFTKGINKDDARSPVHVVGEDTDLGWHVLNMISIIG
jgi:uncharacterized protein (TIGR03083 family)